MSGNQQIHIRHNERSYDFPIEGSGLTERSTDEEVLVAAARMIEVEPESLKDHVVNHRPGGDIVVHPEAMYGGSTAG